MSSGFVTESELAEARRIRQEEWEKVRTEDQPIEAPEEEYDSRPLYQRLEEQKQKKDAEYEEAHRLKNMIRGLDDDEVGFLDLVEQTKATAQRQISLEEQQEMKEFRERVSSLQESAESQRLAQQLSAPLPRKPSTPANSTRAKLQGVIVRKRKASDTDQDAQPAKNGIKIAKPEESQGNTAPTTNSENGHANIKNGENGASAGGSMKCIAVLPGLGHYNDEDTTDSDQSSDSDEVSPKKSPYDLVGRLQEKKKEEK